MEPLVFINLINFQVFTLMLIKDNKTFVSWIINLNKHKKSWKIKLLEKNTFRIFFATFPFVD